MPDKHTIDPSEISSAMKLDDAVRLWRSLGGAVAHLRRTGEMNFTHPSLPRPYRVNGRRKDSPKVLTVALRAVLASLNQEKGTT